MRLQRTKDRIHYALIGKNTIINEEYYDYINNEKNVDRLTKLEKVKYIIKLNYKYRIKTRLYKSKIKKIEKEEQRAKISELYYEEIDRPLPHHFAKSLLSYDVISFDIFDTLVFRPTKDPRDLAYFLDDIFDYPNFKKVRWDSEMTARSNIAIEYGAREANIFEIYEQVERNTGINKDYGIEKEFELELKMCFQNPYMKEVFDILKANGKKVIATSDMYLPKDMIKKLLDSCEFKDIDEIFVSCEYRTNKITGGLYTVVRDYFGKDISIVHIGDNYKSDFVKAKEKGFDARYYKNVNEVKTMYNFENKGMNQLIGSIHSGMINSKLYNGLKRQDKYYEYGYIFGGIYVTGFCRYIAKYAEMYGIEKILFLSRDGSIYKKVFDNLYPDIKTEYFLWSREVSTKLYAEKNRTLYISRFLEAKLRQNRPKKVSELLKELDIIELEKELKKYNIKKNDVLTESKIIKLTELMYNNFDKIIDSMEYTSKIAKKYTEEMIGDSSKVLVVDVGWQGTGGIALKWLVEEKWDLGVKVYNVLAGASPSNDALSLVKFKNGELESYLFKNDMNRHSYLYSKDGNDGLNMFLFEIFTQDASSSFKGFAGDIEHIEYKFSIPEVENYEIIRKIHKGIFEFSNEFSNLFLKFDMIMNISGHDAYTPFKTVSRDSEYIEYLFSDLVYSVDSIDSNEVTKFIEIFNDRRKK